MHQVLYSMQCVHMCVCARACVCIFTGENYFEKFINLSKVPPQYLISEPMSF